LPVICLLALFALSAKPIAARAFHVRPDPDAIEIVGLLEGGHVCVTVSPCASITPASAGIDFPHDGLTFLVVGVLIPVFLVVRPRTAGVSLTIASPPPRRSAA
jgi:hypothetical protein